MLRCALHDESAGSRALPPPLLPWGPPSRDALSHHWLSAGGNAWTRELVQPEMLTGLLLYLSMKEEEEQEQERDLCAGDVKEPNWKLTRSNSGTPVCLQPSQTRDRRQWKVPWIHTHWFKLWAINENHWNDCRRWQPQRISVWTIGLN